LTHKARENIREFTNRRQKKGSGIIACKGMCYQQLELPTNITVVDDAISFVPEDKQNLNIK
jgi:hypothetical protein